MVEEEADLERVAVQQGEPVFGAGREAVGEVRRRRLGGPAPLAQPAARGRGRRRRAAADRGVGGVAAETRRRCRADSCPRVGVVTAAVPRPRSRRRWMPASAESSPSWATIALRRRIRSAISASSSAFCFSEPSRMAARRARALSSASCRIVRRLHARGSDDLGSLGTGGLAALLPGERVGVEAGGVLGHPLAGVVDQVLELRGRRLVGSLDVGEGSFLLRDDAEPVLGRLPFRCHHLGLRGQLRLPLRSALPSPRLRASTSAACCRANSTTAAPSSRAACSSTAVCSLSRRRIEWSSSVEFACAASSASRASMAVFSACASATAMRWRARCSAVLTSSSACASAARRRQRV